MQTWPANEHLQRTRRNRGAPATGGEHCAVATAGEGAPLKRQPLTRQLGCIGGALPLFSGHLMAPTPTGRHF